MRGSLHTTVPIAERNQSSQSSSSLLCQPKFMARRRTSASGYSAEIAAITINARDLTTDNDRRNGAIRRFILQSERDEYQHIVFEPGSVEGLPASVAVGDTFQLQVSGNLTVRDVTNPVTFDVTVTPASESEISGVGVATVNYPDFGLAIPEVPSVTGVEDEVRLEIEFRAVAG